MVNPREDYYAALELRPNADTDEIKKQFKKLARLYHPDRNPGHEEIFKEKFQKIQAAHEVLCDPEQRAKYDAERRKAGIYPYAARPNNPVRNAFAGAYYPAPPRSPTQPFYERKPRPQSAYYRTTNYTSDASDPTPRPSNAYTRPPPPPPFYSHSATTEAEDRADAWRAFGRASDAKRTGHHTQVPTDEDTRKKESAHGYASKPGLGRSNTTAGARKTGYDPNVLGGGWEPQAQKTSSYTTHNPDFLHPQAPNRDIPTPTRPPPSQESTPTETRKPDHLKGFRSHYGEDVPFSEGVPRIRTPYTRHGGETTYFSSDFLRRSSSTQDATRLHKNAKHFRPEPVYPPKSPQRARSASPSSRLKPGQPRPATNDTSQKTPPRTRSKKDGSKPLFDVHNQGSSDADTSSGAESAACEPQTSDMEGEAASRPGHQQEETSKTFRPPQNGQPTGSNTTSPTSANTDGADKGDSQKMHNQFSANAPNLFAQNPAYQNAELRFASNIPVGAKNGPAMGSNTSGSQSNEPVQPQFLSSHWNPRFQANSNQAPPMKRTMSRSKSPSKRSPMGRARPAPPSTAHSGPSSSNAQPNPFDLSGLKLEIPSPNGNIRSSTNDTNRFSEVPPPPPGDPPKNDAEERLARPRGPVKFSSEEWAKQFPGPTWAFPQPTSGNTSPTRGTVPSRRISIAEAERKKTRKQTTTASAAVHEETDGSEPPRDQIPASRQTTPAPPKAQPKPPSPDAMDVDTDMQSNPTTTSGPRLYPAQSGRSDWRDPFSQKSRSGAYIPSEVTTPPQVPTTLPGPPPGPPPKSTRTAPPPPAADNPLNLRSMGSVPPLAPSGQPLDTLPDMRTSVPFTSQPSKHLYFAEKPFDLPRMPLGPEPPTGRLTQSRWDQYMNQFFAYMCRFQKYEIVLLERQGRRNDKNRRFLAGLPDAKAMELQLLTSRREDGEALSGADALVAAGKEDIRVSTALGVARQKRQVCLEAFSRAWERAVREGYVKG